MQLLHHLLYHKACDLWNAQERERIVESNLCHSFNPHSWLRLRKQIRRGRHHFHLLPMLTLLTFTDHPLFVVHQTQRASRPPNTSLHQNPQDPLIVRFKLLQQQQQQQFHWRPLQVISIFLVQIFRGHSKWKTEKIFTWQMLLLVIRT